jgi:hypothetical protein
MIGKDDTWTHSVDPHRSEIDGKSVNQLLDCSAYGGRKRNTFPGPMSKHATRQRDRPVRSDFAAPVFGGSERTPEADFEAVARPGEIEVLCRRKHRAAPVTRRDCKMIEGAKLLKEATDAGFVSKIDRTAVPLRRSTAASTFAALLDAITTSAPISRESAATAKPIPEDPPITTTRFLSSDIAASVIVRLLRK